MSSCTMFLGAGDVCIDPDTVFGFHGPSFWGLALDQPSFDYWSGVIAEHYPEPLRAWYMDRGRYRRTGFFRISGRQIITLGYPSCSVQS